MKRKNLAILFLSIILSIATYSYGQTVVSNNDYFKNGTLHVVNSSHQDIAWVAAPAVCVVDRTDRIMLPLLERLKANPNMCFSVENAMYMQEFIDRYPERYNEILKYTCSGRIEWGSTFCQPYHGLYDGEALLRQIYLGKKDLKKSLPGCDFFTAWNEDVPGLSPQFPQLLAKSGIPYFNISRFRTGFYKWFSPDGSSVIVASTGQYSGYSDPMIRAKSDEERANAFVGLLNYWADYQKSRKIAPAVLGLVSQDCSKPIDYDTLMNHWNNIRKTKIKALPKIQYSTSRMFFENLVSNTHAKFEVVKGARPDVWLYIHGPSHHRAVAAARKASRTLVGAEIFSTFYALLGSGFHTYPQETLHQAWQNAIYADHGWGGADGNITDRLFREKFEMACDIATVVLQKAVTGIASEINYNKDNKYAVTLFNPLSWKRSDPVSVTIDVESSACNYLKVVDAAGDDVPFQFVDNHSYQGNHDEVLTFSFVAQDVPALGYKTYYIVSASEPTTSYQKVAFPEYENAFFVVKFGNGGIESLYDKQQQKEIFNTSNFKGAELFTLKSEGTGAGEFTDIQQPTMEGFDKLSNYYAPWICVEAGAVKDVFQTSAQFKDAKANLRVVMYKTIKKIDVEVDLNGYVGENFREYRIAFPCNRDLTEVAYDMHYGAIEVGKDEIEGMAGRKADESNTYERPAYDAICREIHPREVQDWFSAYNGVQALTISSDVAAFDWVDPANSQSKEIVLQPILLSSRKSCHGAGNYYLQAGNHHFRFSIYSHKGSWKQGYKLGSQPNRPLVGVVTSPESTNGTALPECMSFANVGDGDVVVSTIKKCDDDNALVVRIFNMNRENDAVHFELFTPVTSVFHTNLIEENGVEMYSASNGFDAQVGKSAIETFKLNL